MDEKLTSLEDVVGLKKGDALKVTQEFYDYLQSEGANAWPFKLGGRATVSHVYLMDNCVRITIVDGEYTTGVGGDTFDVDMIKRMRDAANTTPH